MPGGRAFSHADIAKWFFLLLATSVVFLFWKTIQPFAIVLITSGMTAVMVAPVDAWLERIVKFPKLSALITLVFVFVVVIGPLVTLGVVLVSQALEIAHTTVSDPNWVQTFNIHNLSFYSSLPVIVQERLSSIDFALILHNIAQWVFDHIGSLFAGSADLVFKTFLFFICLYFFLVERKEIVKELLVLSPLRDKVDKNIMHRLVETVRGVVFGSLVVSLIQGTLASIGLAVFGVPGALLWGVITIIAAQIPMLGTATTLLPATAYLFLTGHTVAGIGLLVWSLLLVGTIDNLLKPLIVSGRTRMHSVLILLAMLGGIEYFGPVGFILGPTILAAFIVILELYKSGILESKKV